MYSIIRDFCRYDCVSVRATVKLKRQGKIDLTFDMKTTCDIVYEKFASNIISILLDVTFDDIFPGQKRIFH